MSSDHTFSVAVVDDDHRVLESLESLLESAGYRPVLFSSAKALLANDGLFHVDCVITDISMPEIDGFELQRRARVARPALPVILITGRHDLSDPRYSASTAGRRYFHKPFNGSSLLAVIAEELSNAHPSERP